MQAVAITGERQCGLVEKPDPKAAEDIVVVKIHAAPMCTEYKAYKSGSATDCIGHEAAGEVVEVAQPGAVAVGDRVVVMPLYPCGKCPLCLAGEYIHCQSSVDPLGVCGCEAGRATYAQYCLKQDWMLVPIPDGVSCAHASLACCGVGPTFGAIESMGAGAFDTVLVTGLGPVGLGGVINAVYRGARTFGVDSNTYRADLARQLGAEEVFNPEDEDVLERIMDVTGGVDKAVDCSGAPAAQRLMIDSLKRKGHAAFVGEGGDLAITISRDMIRKGVTLHGQWHWNMADAPRMMQMVAASGEQFDKLITHTFPMSKVQDAWELQLTGESGKVVLHPWE